VFGLEVLNDRVEGGTITYFIGGMFGRMLRGCRDDGETRTCTNIENDEEWEYEWKETLEWLKHGHQG
jgi:hypothetical protein